MTKKQKIDFINNVNDRFTNARNHGSHGNSWWYPTPNTIAYNVKLYTGINVEDVRKHLTARQNDYYGDEALYEIINEWQNDTARMFSDDIDLEYGVKSGYSGRSGGWLEVAYQNPLNEVGEETEASELKSLYKEAQELEKLETKIAEHIKKSVASYKKYLESDEAAKEAAEMLQTDEDIAEIYQGKIIGLTKKLK